MCIALFDLEKKIVERVASATALFAPFDPHVLKGDSLDACRCLRTASITCASSRSATRSRRGATSPATLRGSPSSASGRCSPAASR